MYADEFEFQFSGTWSNPGAGWPSGPDYVITITADNGGNSPISQVYVPGDITSISIDSGTLSEGGPIISFNDRGNPKVWSTNTFGQ